MIGCSRVAAWMVRKEGARYTLDATCSQQHLKVLPRTLALVFGIAGLSCLRAVPQGTAHILPTYVPTPAAVQASRVVSGSISGVPKDIVYPLFESAGRLHVALTGNLIPSTISQVLPIGQ